MIKNTVLGEQEKYEFLLKECEEVIKEFFENSIPTSFIKDVAELVMETSDYPKRYNISDIIISMQNIFNNKFDNIDYEKKAKFDLTDSEFNKLMNEITYIMRINFPDIMVSEGLVYRIWDKIHIEAENVSDKIIVTEALKAVLLELISS